MRKVIISKNKCKSCGICVRKCPKNALSIGEEINEKGYKTVVIDSEKCIGCGACFYMCPDCVFELEG